MKIAVIGTGNVGATLGKRWAAAGHSVVFGTRDPKGAKIAALLAQAGPNASAATVSRAAASGEVVVLATPWEATKSAVQSAGGLPGKVVIDCTNPIAPDMTGLSVGLTTSAGEQVAQWAPHARVVKAFNTIGSNVMADPAFGDGAATLLVCGDDADAKKTVSALAGDLGFDVVDAGGLASSRYLEPMAMLWITLAYARKLGRNIAFRLVRR